jgi:hypothetical protein
VRLQVDYGKDETALAVVGLDLTVLIDTRQVVE